jgi:hypothetical protein
MRRFVLTVSLLSLSALHGGATTAAAAPGNTCVFTISMTSGVDVNNLDFTVNYTALDGEIEGTPTQPDCANGLDGQAFAGFHDDDAGHLSVAIVRLGYFSAPVLLAGCRVFYDSLEPLPSDFQIHVSNAGRDGEDNNVNPKPTLVVSSVECPGQLPSPTTTTLPPDTTTTTLGGGAGCGIPVSGGDHPTASDALFTLKAAVGGNECALCVCDVNSNGDVGASDALAILRAAVGTENTLDCPPC